MEFTQNDYLSWYMPLVMGHDDSVNLHASGMASVDPTTLHLPADGDPFQMIGAFQSSLAEWLDTPKNEVLFTPGATGGTLLALLILAQGESNILVEKPIYEPMLRHAARLGEVRRFERKFADRWQLPLDEIADRIDDHTSVVMITEPHNPSGLFAPREQVLELARIAAEHGATLLVNEVYRKYTPAQSYHRAADNIVVVSSLSKLLGAYWARLGWLSGSPEMISRLQKGHWNMGMPSAPSARAGMGFLAMAPQRVAGARELMNSGVEVVDGWIKKVDGLSWHLPNGAGFGCVSLPEGTDDMAFVERLHKEAGVLVIPGTCFDTPGTFRLSWLQAGSRLQDGLNRLSNFFSSIF